jgi:hypothetical protein
MMGIWGAMSPTFIIARTVNGSNLNPMQNETDAFSLGVHFLRGPGTILCAEISLHVGDIEWLPTDAGMSGKVHDL